MPHKHTRRVTDDSTFDLPPSQVARSLSVREQQQKQDGKHKPEPTKPAGERKRKRSAAQKDDAPRAFKRLMAYAGGKKPRSGLDNGDGPTKQDKKKKNNNKQTQKQPDEEQKVEPQPKAPRDTPTIRPGEKMSEFSARVDAALPIAGLVNKSQQGSKDPLGLKKWQTRKEKKMQKMYDEWREEDRKIKEKREEELELQAEKELEDEENGVSWKLEPQGGRKKKGKKGKYIGEVGDDEDPWEALKKKRGETRPGLHDVMKAPPELNKKFSKKLLVGGAAVEVDGIPKSAGSLKRREDLQSVRDETIASYRAMMSQKRPSLRAS
ncbi:hypothetical protein F5Y15DRAFT_254305 [Xylariaceae sp. FL0016]|nr:hypothetical protein F5Y15DRAFT_254305 [Xylariaceae sp. FL0016]